ncbi:MAG: hypothetical protein OXI15_25875 [Chromatiales bacterium]|nr:hypothetical protein [Chromatiales bacterium]
MTRLELLRETFDDYKSLRGHGCAGLDDLPELSFVAVHRKSAQVAADEALFGKVSNVLTGEVDGRAWFRRKLGWTGDPSPGKVHGWARFRSELGWTGHPPPCFEQSGPPIMAEWLDEGVAYRLMPAPSIAGYALVVSVCARPLEPDDYLRDGEEPALCQRLEVLAHPRVAPFTHIAYEVCWGLPSNGSSSATRRLFDRFAGFIEKQEG